MRYADGMSFCSATHLFTAVYSEHEGCTRNKTTQTHSSTPHLPQRSRQTITQIGCPVLSFQDPRSNLSRSYVCADARLYTAHSLPCRFLPNGKATPGKGADPSLRYHPPISRVPATLTILSLRCNTSDGTSYPSFRRTLSAETDGASQKGIFDLAPDRTLTFSISSSPIHTILLSTMASSNLFEDKDNTKGDTA